MVDPARVVAADLGIDYCSVFEAEIECVRVVFVVGSAIPGYALACIFDDAGAFRNELRAVDAAAVHTRLANLNPDGCLWSFGFPWHGN